MKIGVNPSSELLPNLVIQLYKYVDLVLLTKFY